MFRINIKQLRVQLGLQDVKKVVKRSIHRKNTYYDLLGITPKATQADIKNAFYKLSMQFHPDKSTGDDIKFREINAAYEVLGNLKLRRLYDKGYLPVGASSSTYQDIKDSPEPDPLRDDFRGDFKRQRPKRGEPPPPPPTGRTASYNFDEWTRMHYSDTFSRSRSRMDQFQWVQYKRSRQQYDEAVKARLLKFVSFVAIFALLYNATIADFDKVPRSVRKD